jgi:hypothetical protein
MMKSRLVLIMTFLILTCLLSPFPDKDKMTDGRSWLPLRMALALGDKVREEDVYMLYSLDPLAMQLYSSEGFPNDIYGAGFLPSHLFSIQTNLNLTLISYLSMRDTKTLTMSAHRQIFFRTETYDGSLNTLQVAAEYSDSVEHMRCLLQIDQSMANAEVHRFLHHTETSSTLYFLCGRSYFFSFDEMLKCLLMANSSAEVAFDGLKSCFRSHGRSECVNTDTVLTLVESLLEANSTIMNYVNRLGENIIHLACQYLEGTVAIAILSLISATFSYELEFV